MFATKRLTVGVRWGLRLTQLKRKYAFRLEKCGMHAAKCTLRHVLNTDEPASRTLKV
jgi:hypothetical protein